MIITIKNLQQQTFTIELEPEQTVLELKTKIFEERGYSIEKQKLIYAGIILDDVRTIASYNIAEKRFVVVMVKRDVGYSQSADQEKNSEGNQQKTGNETESQAHATTGSNTTDTCGKPINETEVSGPGDAGENSANEPVQSSAESHLLMGEEYEKTVESMVEMGYSRETVERAMAASFNNPERAVEYLVSGIPELNYVVDPLQQGESRDSNENVERRQAENETMAEDPFEFLRDQPQFLQMRSLIYENPDLLQAVLQQIGQTNPALLQLISENQDAFLNMLNQPIDGRSSGQVNITSERRMQLSDATRAASASLAENNATVEAQATRSATRAESGANEGRRHNSSENQTSTPISIRLTSQEKEAIERLKAMGFPEALVLQAYFACEKDEQLAANFLISSSFDD